MALRSDLRRALIDIACLDDDDGGEPLVTAFSPDVRIDMESARYLVEAIDAYEVLVSLVEDGLPPGAISARLRAG
ncbi:MAG: hypothetical protein GC151_13820 [Betaproteobacteria bacterium]|nr:hypothetical protein [Betaproteobacteria bacterium]